MTFYIKQKLSPLRSNYVWVNKVSRNGLGLPNPPSFHAPHISYLHGWRGTRHGFCKRTAPSHSTPHRNPFTISLKPTTTSEDQLKIFKSKSSAWYHIAKWNLFSLELVNSKCFCPYSIHFTIFWFPFEQPLPGTWSMAKWGWPSSLLSGENGLLIQVCQTDAFSPPGYICLVVAPAPPYSHATESWGSCWLMLQRRFPSLGITSCKKALIPELPESRDGSADGSTAEKREESDNSVSSACLGAVTPWQHLSSEDSPFFWGQWVGSWNLLIRRAWRTTGSAMCFSITVSHPDLFLFS